jgi:GTP cyclohydrolase II
MKSNAVKSYELELDWSAQTMLPIEFRGQELHLEARAYQGTDPHNQAFVLIHRTDQAGNERPLVRVHSGCVTGDIFH